MSIRGDALDRLVIPDGTTVEEHDLVTDGDVIIGGLSTVEFGVRGRSVIVGERTVFGGSIESKTDCRLDMWCEVDGNVLVGADAYIGERVHVNGKLMVSGDLDIGDDVTIDEGFEASGWIVIRNPMPAIIYLFIYLSHMLRIGEEEAAGEMAAEFLDDDRPKQSAPLVIPRGSRVSDDTWQVSTDGVIGDNCRLHGNIRARRLDLGANNEVFGSLRTKRCISIGEGTRIHGDVTTRHGTVTIGKNAEILGDVSCGDLDLHEAARIDGSIRATGEMSISNETPLSVGPELEPS
ncbi:polymer-forming cytoskeletal protein [Halocatena halophila]|uniref:polymer-forming cytoskeletal protein n=1 Tax=Halocatena halophila TaxID=2814576 RepID=UPI0038B38344